MKPQAIDSIDLHSKSHTKDDGTQNYLVFQRKSLDILKRLVILILFHYVNLKDFLRKVIILLLHLFNTPTASGA